MVEETIQDKMIGKHPTDDNIFSDWLVCKDLDCTETKIHRSLTEKADYREQSVEEISNWLVSHHLSNRKRDLLKKKKEILEKYDFKEYANNLHILPQTDKTKKGNIGEVILAEYLHISSGIDTLIYRLRYNPNVDQSMKGDDVLLIGEKDILLGESKFRTTAGKSVVEEISNNFGKALKLPISLSFVADRLYEDGKYDLSDKITEIESILSKGKIDIQNVGFILSDPSAHRAVENHMNSHNKNFIMITLNIDDPKDLLDKSFEKANEKIKGDF
ncbi:Hachiman antiphage defense system protein HamA [Clostridium estertheticum]|uniref:Hachiman antiphage defense system protein HamA n=1 Tax=Clostridium estertheticum TaxID=238834 RepID=UPI001CF5AFEA|nr:Hachiman antiphage defense system protein HamA [Clostridium estertheticum]MCB2353137.1 DUF1837 domain-containing protein [Clostridium estertheticum]WAG41493.1 DUF1837 domain-containing protein [Clostridium estertheticum]